MAVFLEKLREARIVIPSNVQRLQACGEPQHPGCFIYSFGTRRLHVAMREGDGGRVTVVVRCGGGFLDFVDFCRRHGSVEQLKLSRRVDSNGKQHIQLVSFRSRGNLKLSERPVSRN